MDTFEIASDFSIDVQPATKKYLPHLEADVERIWDEEKRRCGDHLYNGKLLNLISLTPHLLIGEPSDYKHYLAAHVDPSLAPTLGVNPVAVTGIVCSSGKYLLGVRAHTVLNYHGLLEFVPSGGIEEGIDIPGRISPTQQLLIELYEETGIDPTLVLDVAPLFAIKERQWGPLDICIRINLAPEALAHKAFPYAEHSAFHWMTREELMKESGQHPERFSPLALEITRLL